MTQAKSTSLYCREGSSDKVYNASLQQQGGGWVVEFAYGPRGKALKTGTKTACPVEYAAAVKIYDKLVKEKTAKGYTPDESGVAYTNTEHAGRASGLAAQLPTAISEEQGSKLLDDPEWGMQEKRDGENRLLMITTDLQVRGVNKKGLLVDIPVTWAQQFDALGPCVIAGEHMAGDVFDAFDLLEMRGVDLRGRSYDERYAQLLTLSQQLRGNAAFRVLPLYGRVQGRREQLELLRSQNAEGVVFKHLASSFEEGRSKAALKWKFVESLTCIVVARNAQRSVAVGALDDSGYVVNLGNVTIPANHGIPSEGDLVEVQYLYRFESGCLEQPVYKGLRTDIFREEATVAQITRIKRKSETSAPQSPARSGMAVAETLRDLFEV